MPPVGPAGGARYASPKAGGGLYQADPYFDTGAGSWYVPPNGAPSGGYVGPGANTPYSTGHQQQQPGQHHQGGGSGLHHMGHSPHISSPPNHHHPDPYGGGGSGGGPNGGPVLGATGVPHMDSDLVQVVSGETDSSGQKRC